MSVYQIETRRRSRSKTPFLRSTCDHENCEHPLDGEHHLVHPQKQQKRAKTPSMRPIVEVEVTSSSSPQAAVVKQTKTKTSDYSSEETSPENKVRKSLGKEFSALSATAVATTTTQMETASTTYTSSSSSTVTRKVTRGGAIGSATAATILAQSNNMATSTPKNKEYAFQQSFAAQYSDAAQDESRQNELNATQERVRQSLQQQNTTNYHSTSKNNSTTNNSGKNQSFSRGYNSSTTSSLRNLSNRDIDPNDHLPYIEYVTAGEYWNVTPKTDYTYSELSPHRRVLAPGMVAMPNMSRRSLGNYNYNEESIRRRFQSDLHTERREYSDDELDHFEVQEVQVSWWRRFISSFLAIFTTTYAFLTGGNKSKSKSCLSEEAYYRKYSVSSSAEKAGFFGSIANFFLRFTKYAMDTDSYLLKPGSSTETEGQKSRYWLLLVLLLPWLLLGAWFWAAEENERQNYLTTAQSFLPLTMLTSLKAVALERASSVKEFIEFPASFWQLLDFAHKDENKNLIELEHNVQKALSKEEYEQLLIHVNNYMQQLVNLKLHQQEEKETKLNAEQIQLIVQILKDNVENLLREKRDSNELNKMNSANLNEEEINKLALLVSNQLKDSGWQQERLSLTQQDLKKIQTLIKEQLVINNYEHFTLINEKLDLDALLLRILSAPQMAEFIDTRINAAILKHNLQNKASYTDEIVFSNLREEVEFLKLTFSDKLSENADLQQSISKLQVAQTELLQRLKQHEMATGAKFTSLIAEIESKLATLKYETFNSLNKQVKLSLVEILGFKAKNLKEADLEAWVRDTFVAKDYLEQRLLSLQNKTHSSFQAELDRTAAVLMRDISERLKKETMEIVERKQVEITTNHKFSVGLNETRVREIVKSVLTVYDADKTGLADFALESAGGEVLSTRCTESYQVKSAQVSVFGIPLWYPSNTPRVAIAPSVQPGNCWAFQGFPGYLVLKLNSLIYVTGFTLEHIPKELSPTGNIGSAPRNFTVWGLEFERDQDPVLFGEYEYEENGVALQYFPVQNAEIKRPYEIVELRIETNHGNLKYTCLYRFRVHGQPLNV